MSDNPTAQAENGSAEGFNAFQKIWTDSMTKMMQAGFMASVNSLPPEQLREIRGSIFRSLADSWAEFMRSPQFLAAMKQSMDQAVNLRKISSDFLGKARNQMQAPSLDDVAAIMLSVRQVETRLEDLSEQIKELSNRLASSPPKVAAAAAGGGRRGNVRKSPTGKA